MYLGYPYGREQKVNRFSKDDDWKKQWPKRCQNQECREELVEGIIPIEASGEIIQIRIMFCPNGCDN